MHVAHSNVATEKTTPALRPLKKMSAAEQFAYGMAVKGWQRALKKYAADIAEIKEYFPQWEPKLEIK